MLDLGRLLTAFLPDHLDPLGEALGDLLAHAPALGAAIQSGSPEEIASAVREAVDDMDDALEGVTTEAERDAILDGLVALVTVSARAAGKRKAKGSRRVRRVLRQAGVR